MTKLDSPVFPSAFAPLGSPNGNGTATFGFEVIAADLARVEVILTESLGRYAGALSPVVGHLRHYHGKRLRPALMLLTARACGTVTSAHHHLAAAVEMIHTATLVHDDVLDDAQLRRHHPSINAIWGNKVSILLGDLLFSKAFHLASMVGDATACERIGDATNRVCAGEMLQTCETGNLDLNEETYFEIIDGKTAALTECASHLGAVYAGASDKVIEQMRRFGQTLGLAFQIGDDLLDLEGDEATVGKTLGTDLAQGKLTLPLIRLLASCEGAERVQLRDWLQMPDGHGKIISILRQSDALVSARAEADRLAQQASEELAILPDSEAKMVLSNLPAWAVRRCR